MTHLSLRTKILIAVLGCAVLPLALVAAWLTRSVSGAGEAFIEAQLDSIAVRAAQTAVARWEFRKADILLLADNEPVKRGLAPGADSASVAEAERYLETAIASMPAVTSAIVRDAAGRVRWSLGVMGITTSPDPRATRPGITLRHDVVDDSARQLGSVEADVRLDTFLASPSAPTDAGAGFVAVHNRESGSWLIPGGAQSSLVENSRFAWDGHQWASVKKVLTDPPLDIVAAAPIDGFVETLTQSTRSSVLALGIVAVFVVLLTMYVTGRLMSSLRLLADAADAVARGELETRVEVREHDEVGRVARTFNQMTASVRTMMEERSQREAVVAMGEMAATLAHQVRSPATAMRLDLERAVAMPGNTPQHALIERALVQLDRLERSVSSSLSVARVTASAMSSTGDVDLREPLGRAIAGAASECARRGVRVTEHGVDQAAPVQGDDASLEQLFANLLANAAQASSSGGTVAVSLAVHDDGPTITIADTGKGMSADVLARAGEPFFSTKPEGTGLGLTIARRIAAAHGAELNIQSEGGVGTRVVLAFPCRSGGQHRSSPR